MDVFLHLSLSSVILIDSSTESPVHVLMLSIQAVRGLPRLRAPGIVPCIISCSCSQYSCSVSFPSSPQYKSSQYPFYLSAICAASVKFSPVADWIPCYWLLFRRSEAAACIRSEDAVCIWHGHAAAVSCGLFFLGIPRALLHLSAV